MFFKVIIRKAMAQVLRLISLLFRKKKKYYLFGTNGNAKSSNTLPLFLKMQSLGFNCYWVYDESDKVVGVIDEKFLIRKGTLEHIILSLRSKVFFITLTLSDVFIAKPVGTHVVNLWHGAPIKKMAFDSNVFLTNYRVKRMLGFKTEFTLWDVFCCSSKFYANILSSAFHLDLDRFALCGSMKNYQVDRTIKTTHDSLNSFSNIILYAPTYRAWPSNYLDFLHSEKLENFLNGNNVVLIVKLHPYESNKVDDILFSDNVMCSDSLFPDLSIEDLYSLSDVLITDASSAIFDFSLTQRPFLFFASDFDDYEKRIGGSYLDIKNDFPNQYMKDLDSLVYNLCFLSDGHNFEKFDLTKYIDQDVEYNSVERLINELSNRELL